MSTISSAHVVKQFKTVSMQAKSTLKKPSRYPSTQQGT